MLALEQTAEIHFASRGTSEARSVRPLAVSMTVLRGRCTECSCGITRPSTSNSSSPVNTGVCAAALNDELGVHPDEETVQLFRKLTAGQ